MSWIRTLTATGAIVVGASGLTFSQEPPGKPSGERPAKNPLGPTPEVLKTGMAQFRARCAPCHGVDAKGVRGPDITGLYAAGSTDGGLFDTVRRGVPGTEMPPAFYTTDDEIWRMLAYLRTLSAPVSTVAERGNPRNGERIFSEKCSSCHRVTGRGGRLGPDLSRVGARRTRQVLASQIRGAVEELPPGYEPVTLTTEAGRAIRGVKKNEDVFSVQIMDTGERIQGYLRADLREVRDEKSSLMPKYDVAALPERDLDDVLAYLGGLRGSVPGAAR